MTSYDHPSYPSTLIMLPSPALFRQQQNTHQQQILNEYLTDEIRQQLSDGKRIIRVNQGTLQGNLEEATGYAKATMHAAGWRPEMFEIVTFGSGTSRYCILGVNEDSGEERVHCIFHLTYKGETDCFASDVSERSIRRLADLDPSEVETHICANRPDNDWEGLNLDSWHEIPNGYYLFIVSCF